jgi:hypothetical protein
MIFSTVFAFLLIALAFALALPALWMLAEGLLPAGAARRRVLAERRPWRTFFLGLLPVIGGVALVSALSKAPQLGALAALAAGLLITWGLMGAGGYAGNLGARLWPAVEPWRQLRNGGLTLVCCALLPVAGWFVLLPLLLVAGWGLHVRGWLERGKNAAPSAQAEPAAPLA